MSRTANTLCLTGLVGALLVAVVLSAVLSGGPCPTDHGQRVTFDNGAPLAAVSVGRDVAARQLPAVLPWHCVATRPPSRLRLARSGATSTVPAASLLVRPLRI